MKLHFEKHCTDEYLIAYLDGELSGLASRSVRRHLEACWQCRAHLDELAEQIRQVTIVVEDDMFPGPERVAWARMRILAGARRVAESTQAASPARVGVQPVTRWCLAAACAVLLVGVAIIRTLPRTTKLAPVELLARAAGSDGTANGSLIFQEFKIVVEETRPAQRQRETRLRIWSEPGGSRFASKLQDGEGHLKHALWLPGEGQEYRYRAAVGHAVPSAAHTPVTRDITAYLSDQPGIEQVEAALMAWLENRAWRPVSLAADLAVFVSAGGVTASVERDGELLRLRARGSRGRGTLEFTLEIEPGNYRPRLARIRYDAPDSAFSLSLIPNPVGVIPAAVFKPDLPLPVKPLHESTPVVRLQSPVTVTHRDVDEIEAETRFALHRIRACLGEPIEVLRDADGSVLVRGLAVTRDRKEQVAAALGTLVGSGELTLEVRTTEEAMRDQTPAGPSVPVPLIPGPAPERRALHVLLQGRLGSAQEAARFASRVVSSSEELLSEAWALRRLAERYGSRLDRLPPRARILIEAMVRDHLTGYEQRLHDARDLLRSVVPAAGELRDIVQPEQPVGTAERWDSVALDVFTLTARVHRDLLALFAGSDLSARPNDLLQEVLRLLPELDVNLRDADARLAARSGEER